MSETRDIEREEVEIVFGLTGGELSDRPWAVFRHWYEGPPAYHKEDLPEEGMYRTAVTCALYRTLPKELEDGRAVYKLEQSFEGSGEAPCPGSDEGDGRVAENQCNTHGRCWYCDERIYEPHSFVYIGPGWVEAVYRMEERLE